MRNSTIKKVLQFQEKVYGKVQYSLISIYDKGIDNSMVEVRRQLNCGNIVLLYEAYAKLIWACLGWLFAKGLIVEDEIEDNREGFELGASHIDLLLSYLEDLVGTELMDELVLVLLESKLTLTIKQEEGLPLLIEGKKFTPPNFSKFLEKREKEGKKLLTK